MIMNFLVEQKMWAKEMEDALVSWAHETDFSLTEGPQRITFHDPDAEVVPSAPLYFYEKRVLSADLECSVEKLRCETEKEVKEVQHLFLHWLGKQENGKVVVRVRPRIDIYREFDSGKFTITARFRGNVL